MQLPMQYAILKRVAVLQKWPWLVGYKKSLFNVSYAKFRIFREVSIVGRRKTLKSERMRCSVGFLLVNCSFKLEKSLKMSPKLSKKVLAVV